MNTNSELIKARLLKCLALSFLLVIPVIGFSQVTYPTIGRNCAEATTICTKESIIVQSTSNGDKGTGANRPSCSGLPYNQSTFMVFTVKQTGTLNFDIIPESPL